MTDLRTAAQQALEALLNFPDDISDAMFESITALKAALAQEQAEAHTTTLRALLERCLSWEPDACVLGNVTAQDAAAALRAALAQEWAGAMTERDHVDFARWHSRLGELADAYYAAGGTHPARWNARAELMNHALDASTGWRVRSAAAVQQQAEPAQDQRCRAEPRSDGDFVCDCKIGECPGRSAEPAQGPVAWRFKPMIGSPWSLSDDGYYISCKRDKGYIVEPLYAAPPQRTMVPLTEKEMYAVEEEARKNFRLSQKGPRGQQITYWDGLTPWLIRAVERAHGIKE